MAGLRTSAGPRDSNGGRWSHGTMPGMTPNSSPTGTYARVTDPSIAYDPEHDVWMVSSIGLTSSTKAVHGKAVLLNRSTNGGTSWGAPVTVKSARRGQDFDKNWAACDGTSSSPFYGNCYTGVGRLRPQQPAAHGRQHPRRAHLEGIERPPPVERPRGPAGGAAERNGRRAHRHRERVERDRSSRRTAGPRSPVKTRSPRSTTWRRATCDPTAHLRRRRHRRQGPRGVGRASWPRARQTTS
jgi:hypothetical protein